jgi:hypothetical protein
VIGAMLSPARAWPQTPRKSAAAAAKVVKRFVMPGPLAVLIDQADRLAPRCAHSYGASGAQSRYRIMPTTTPRIYSDVLIAVALWPIAYLSNRHHGHRA